jgi:hypothetical protein
LNLLPEFLLAQVFAFPAFCLVLLHPDLIAAGFFRFVRLVFLAALSCVLFAFRLFRSLNFMGEGIFVVLLLPWSSFLFIHFSRWE